LGNDPAEVLPVMELDFAKLPSEHPRIYGHGAKSDPTSPQYNAVNAIVATELPPEIRARIAKAGADAAYALKVRDYARVDIRLAPDGTPLVIEVNANPYLEKTSVFALGALQAGMGYTTLINRIVEIARKRSEQTQFLKELQKTRAEKAKARRHLEKSIQSLEKANEERARSEPHR
jgi:D-alanine-D-alanine ligase